MYTYRIFDANPAESDGNGWLARGGAYDSAQAALQAAIDEIDCADLHASDGYAVGDQLYVLVYSSEGTSDTHTVTVERVDGEDGAE